MELLPRLSATRLCGRVEGEFSVVTSPRLPSLRPGEEGVTHAPRPWSKAAATVPAGCSFAAFLHDEALPSSRKEEKKIISCFPIPRAEAGWGSFERTGLHLCRSEELSQPRTALRLSVPVPRASCADWAGASWAPGEAPSLEQW